MSDPIYLVMDAGTPVAAFTARQALRACLRRRLDTFCNPLVYTFADGRELAITTLSRALADREIIADDNDDGVGGVLPIVPAGPPGCFAENRRPAQSNP
jgi:hypothetical protein